MRACSTVISSTTIHTFFSPPLQLPILYHPTLGKYLDNSGSGDEYFVILKHHRMPVARVNLSTLLSLASE
jgi:hypothetical protein